MAVRVLTGLLLAPLVLLLFVFGPDWSLWVFFQGVAAIGVYELFRMLFPEGWRLEHRVALVVSAAIPTLAWLDPPHLALHLTLAFLAIATVKLFRPAPLERANGELGRLSLGLLYGGLLYSFPLLLASEHRPWLLVLAAAVWAGDTGAYFSGRLLGRNKLYPLVSPKKTIEGSIGGVLASAGGGWIAWALSGLAHDPWPAEWAAIPVASAVGFGAVVGVIEQMGDLVESLVKRSAGVKDSGSILPGHGGVLDRFDGFVYAAPVLYGLVALAG